MNEYEYRHVVGLGETSMVGNVYFARYLDWQGRCRETFLFENAPEVIDLLQSRELALATRSCSCNYSGADGFYAGDEVLVRMTLTKFRGARMSLAFEYCDARDPERVVATGHQEVACLVRGDSGWIPSPFPLSFMQALVRCTENAELLESLRNAISFVEDRSEKSSPTGRDAPVVESAARSVRDLQPAQRTDGDRR